MLRNATSQLNVSHFFAFCNTFFECVTYCDIPFSVSNVSRNPKTGLAIRLFLLHMHLARWIVIPDRLSSLSLDRNAAFENLNNAVVFVLGELDGTGLKPCL